ncbi:MAG: 4Fe-4S dicluster domain-containing protein, partial [Polyangiaceae bacterium]|nr:4Fe-4S dicluster domain-containing protein [Polyangiaceae bacterium]
MSQTNQDSQSLATLRIDGRSISAPEGSYLLDAARKAGIEIPTLCNHPDLEPFGACRICTVEVTHPDWNGWTGLMTACLYPVKNGLEVSTRSERVIEARRGILALLAARCPNSDTIQALAKQYDVRTARLESDPESDNCIMCGLCTRVCDTFATGAITTVGRGSTKRISSFADQPPCECVGCGACATACPTGEIRGERTDSHYRIWNRDFPTAHCTVDSDVCIGCGMCEEACPFAVARVAIRVDGTQQAVIPNEHCRGCGACVGACPTGAISQRGFELCAMDPPEKDKLLVLACHRSNLGHACSDAKTVLWPCTGRVSVPLLLNAIASQSSGVLVLGRHKETCRLGGAEVQAEKHVRTAQELIELIGLDPDLVRFEQPAPGMDGARHSVIQTARAIQAIDKVPAPSIITIEHEGMDASLKIISAMTAKLGSRIGVPPFLARHGVPTANVGPVLLAGAIPELHILMQDFAKPANLIGTLFAAVAVLQRFGFVDVCVCEARHADEAAFALEPTEGAVFVDDVLRERGGELPRPAGDAVRVAYDGNPLNAGMLVSLGYEPVDVGADPLPSDFRFSSAHRARAIARLASAEQARAAVMLVSNPGELARWALLTRSGAWRSSRVIPVLGVELAYRAITGANG